MSIWQEGLKRIANLRIPKDFDGNAILSRFYSSGKHHIQYEADIEKVRKYLSDFSTEEEAIEFLMGEVTNQLEDPVPLK